MFILNKPYVSDLLKETIEKNMYNVLKNETSTALNFAENTMLLSDKEFIDKFKNKNLLYTNSENSIEWILKNIPDSDTARNITLFKNKFKFRELIKEIYPDFFYKEVKIEELHTIDISSIKKPFILKPTIGFLSLGVYTIFNDTEFQNVIKTIAIDIEKNKNLFPKEVIDTSSFIIEEYIEGDEYAFDAYYNSNGEPVILNILHHLFSSKEDVSDRLYVTSKKIIEENLEKFEKFLKKIGSITHITNFPVHVEVRVKDHKIIPIEINPMRFAGWCTTDVAFYSYEVNPYSYFMEQKKVDWKAVLANKDEKIYSLIVLESL